MKPYYTNPHEEQLQRLHEAKNKWDASEKILNILRSQTSTPIPQPTDKELLLWYQKK